MKSRIRHDVLVWGLVGGVLFFVSTLWAQELGEDFPGLSEKKETIQVALAKPVLLEPTLISLDFKDADVRTVLQALARKAGVNIVTGLEVSGPITIHLDKVTWEQALSIIVKTYGYAHEKDGNVILVTTLEDMRARREMMKELTEIEPVTTEIMQLKYLEATDVRAFLEPQLSPQGRISVLEATGQKGWDFGAPGGDLETRGRRSRENTRSKSIMVTDTPTTIERLKKILVKIDVLPQQILIEARIMEVSRDLLEDIDLGGVTGATAGSSSLTVANQAANTRNLAAGDRESVAEFAITQIASDFTPSIFIPATTGLTAAIAGTQFFFSKLRGTQFSALLRLLEEDVRTNTLSAPNILTLSGQEARILIGEKYPILNTQVSGTSTTTTTTTLDYYQDIGIELFVVPQISGDKYIDMIVHPVVSTRTGTIGTNAYPILAIREAETQILLGRGETVMIGGLLKDVKSKSRIGMPFLGRLPIIGPLFARTTTDLQKIDLLIFITAKVVEPSGLSEEETPRLQRQYDEFLLEKMVSKLQKSVEKVTPKPKKPVEKMTPQPRKPAEKMTPQPRKPVERMTPKAKKPVRKQRSVSKPPVPEPQTSVEGNRGIFYRKP